MMSRQLPVHSPIAPSSLARAAVHAARRDPTPLSRLAERVSRDLDADAVALTDSGTSALVWALRLAAPRGGTVAMPAYVCINLTAAARYAKVRVRLYDIDPHTLSPDLDSLAATLRRGVDAVVVAHLYGFPADVPAVVAMAGARGVPVIEDAAQAAGGTLRGAPIGALAPLVVLSYGRGKGITGGNGGALVARGAAWSREVEALSTVLEAPPAGWRDLALATAHSLFGRPSLYPVPSAMPFLRLGEMVYHAADEPRALSIAAATLVTDASRLATAELEARQRNAARIAEMVRASESLEMVRPIRGGTSGYLRAPVLDRSRSRVADVRHGIWPGYPRTMAEQSELHAQLRFGEREQPGALELRRSLFTMPTHSLVRESDFDAIRRWMRAGVIAPRPVVSRQLERIST